MESFLREVERMLAQLALAIAPLVTAATTFTPHALDAMAPAEVWARDLGDVRGIAVDGEGRVWVTDHAGGRLLRLDGPGAARVVASGLQGPLGIAVDDTGRVLVAEEYAGRIVHVGPSGTLAVVATDLERPRWLAVAEDGVIYVSAHREASSLGDGDVTRPGVVLAVRAGTPPALVLDELRDPEGLAVRGGVLYVATRGREPGHEDPILEVPLASAGVGIVAHADGTVRKPVGVAVDGRGTVFVSATRLDLSEGDIAGVIARLEPATVAVFASGADDPQGLAFDADGHLYLAERPGGRVVRFVAPRPPAVDPLPAWTNAPSVVVSGHAEPQARVEITGAEAPVGAFTDESGAFTASLALVPNTLNEVRLRAVGHDGAGLTSPPTELTIVQDGVAPTVILDSPPTGAVVRGAVVVRASAADAPSELAAFELLAGVQGLGADVTPPLPAPAATAAAGWDTSAGSDGVHTLAARAVDRAGNVASVSRSIIVDNTPPTTELAGPAASATTLRFTLGGSDNVTPAAELAFAWRLDDGAWSEFSRDTDVLLADLAPGPHRLEAKARDRAGNEDPTPAVVPFTVGAGVLAISILDPAAGTTLTAGSVLVRGTVEAAGTEIGVTVNGLPGWLEGSTFIALVDLAPDSTAIVAVASAADGRVARATIPISVVDGPSLTLVTTPWSGVTPLTVRFSLPGDVTTAHVELDADGDGVAEFSGERLDDHAITYLRPGVYVARARVTDTSGRVASAAAVVRAFEPAALDGLLRARWNAMRDALRRGDVVAGVGHIVARRRADYETAFRLLSASLPAIDAILADLRLVKVRNASAIYEMRRVDDGLSRSFEVRFAVDADGVWRVEAF